MTKDIERGKDRYLFGSQVSPHFGEEENKFKCQSLRESRVENRE